MVFRDGLTDIRRQWTGGLPPRKPVPLSDREWSVLTRHVTDNVGYAQLARELGVSRSRVREVALTASKHLRLALRIPGGH